MFIGWSHQTYRIVMSAAEEEGVWICSLGEHGQTVRDIKTSLGSQNREKNYLSSTTKKNSLIFRKKKYLAQTICFTDFVSSKPNVLEKSFRHIKWSAQNSKHKVLVGSGQKMCSLLLYSEFYVSEPLDQTWADLA